MFWKVLIKGPDSFEMDVLVVAGFGFEAIERAKRFVPFMTCPYGEAEIYDPTDDPDEARKMVESAFDVLWDGCWNNDKIDENDLADGTDEYGIVWAELNDAIG